MSVKKELIEKLSTIMPRNEAQAEFYFALSVLTGRERLDLMRDEDLSPKDIEKLLKAVSERLNTQKPLQYILNTAYFCGKKFYVDENVLIPRPETELLLNEVLRLAKANGAKKILEIGTGSGCLAIMAKLCAPEVEVFASDISKEALETAQKNAALHNLEDKIMFIHSDIFENITEKFDIIFSNPPYIPHSEKEALQSEVRLSEPHQALFSDDDGLFFYKKIAAEAKKYLNKNSCLAFEIGIDQSAEIKKILEIRGFSDITIIKDLNKIPRVISAKGL